jgi:hypothetical protein
MNARVQAQLRERNPWNFRHIDNLELVRTVFCHRVTSQRPRWRCCALHRSFSTCARPALQENEDLNSAPQAVVFASPGMLQSGFLQGASADVSLALVLRVCAPGVVLVRTRLRSASRKAVVACLSQTTV